MLTNTILNVIKRFCMKQFNMRMASVRFIVLGISPKEYSGQVVMDLFA